MKIIIMESYKIQSKFNVCLYNKSIYSGLILQFLINQQKYFNLIHDE